MTDRRWRRIPTNIWRDPAFIGLPGGAQLLWFYRRTHPHPGRFTPEQMAELWDTTPDVVRSWACELATTKYGGVLNGAGQRPWIRPQTRQAVLDRDGNTCLNCGCTNDLTLDHIYPWLLGGGEELDNLQTLCRGCNSRKGSRVEVSP